MFKRKQTNSVRKWIDTNPPVSTFMAFESEEINATGRTIPSVLGILVQLGLAERFSVSWQPMDDRQ